MATTSLRKEIELTSPTRQRVMGIVFLVLAAGIWLLFGRGTEGGLTTTFNLVPGGIESNLPDWKLPTLATLNVMALFSAFAGGVQLVRGFGRRTNLVKLFQPVHEGKCEIVEGESPEEAGTSLAAKLREAKIL